MITNKQKEDIRCIKWFISHRVKFDKVTNKDIKLFLDYSERGLNKKLIDCRKTDGFNALIQGKRWKIALKRL